MSNFITSIVTIFLTFLIGFLIRMFYGENILMTRYRVSKELNELNNISIKIQNNNDCFSRNILQEKLNIELQNLLKRDLALLVGSHTKLLLIKELLKNISPLKIKKLSILKTITFKKDKVLIDRTTLFKNSEKFKKSSRVHWLWCIFFIVLSLSLLILSDIYFHKKIPNGISYIIIVSILFIFYFELIALYKAEYVLSKKEYKEIFKSIYNSKNIKIVKNKNNKKRNKIKTFICNLL